MICPFYYFGEGEGVHLLGHANVSMIWVRGGCWHRLSLPSVAVEGLHLGCRHWMDWLWLSQGLAQDDLSSRLPASFLSVANSKRRILTGRLSPWPASRADIAPTRSTFSVM